MEVFLTSLVLFHTSKEFKKSLIRPLISPWFKASGWNSSLAVGSLLLGLLSIKSAAGNKAQLSSGGVL